MLRTERLPNVPYTDAVLEEMLGQAESDLSERKESFSGSAPTTVREAVCAMANDLPGHDREGAIFIGAKDDGTPSGMAITDQLLLQLADIKTDGNIVPPPTLTIQKRRLAGAEMAVITVSPADSPPVRYKGRIWVRIGPRRGTASAQDERILNERRRFRDRPFDMQPVPSATLRDLQLRYFEETYLPSAIAPGVLDANDRSVEQRLLATKMLTADDPPIPTVLGILVLGTNARDFLPGAYVQFLRVDGLGLSSPVVDEQAIDGNVANILQRIDDKLSSHNRVAVDFASAGREERRPEYPVEALQQIARNAVLHRAYENTNAPVRITWYADRVEVISPGGPYGTVTPENFGEAGITDYRNPNLAEALRVLGFVQRFGAGIVIAREALAKNGNPPLEFTVQPSIVGVTMKALL